MADIVSIIIKGGLVMIPLLLCSIISLAVTIERFLYWRRISSKEPVEHMLRSVEQGKYNEALSDGQESPLPAARVLAAGLEHRNPFLFQGHGSGGPRGAASSQASSRGSRHHHHFGSSAGTPRHDYRHDQLFRHHVRRRTRASPMQ